LGIPGGIAIAFGFESVPSVRQPNSFLANVVVAWNLTIKLSMNPRILFLLSNQINRNFLNFLLTYF
jgi:hypothetical protein